MGMFDSVIARCPKCDGEVEYQSKAGDCLLRTFYPDEVPLDIAASLQGDYSCCGVCGELWKIITDELPPPSTVKMRLE